MYKKGDLVTRIASWNQFGTVYVTHFVVSSWGKKQATLIKINDGTNAKFRVYTADVSRNQGMHSYVIIPTSEYSDELAMVHAAAFIKEEDSRAEARWQHAQDRYPTYEAYGSYDKDAMLKHERKVYDDHKAVAWVAKVIQVPASYQGVA